MKKMFFMGMAIMALWSCDVYADNDKMIQSDYLPMQAKEFISNYFNGIEVSYAKEEREALVLTGYEVMFSNGDKVEFDKKGQWTDVDCKYSVVPTGIVPTEIANYVTQKHPQEKIVQIDCDKRDYELELSNGIELKFDLKYNLIGYDN